MTLGVGGSTIAAELERLHNLRDQAVPIDAAELRGRVAKVQAEMRARGVRWAGCSVRGMPCSQVSVPAIVGPGGRGVSIAVPICG